MASANCISAIQPRPALATTYEGDDPELLERLAPLVDMIEISPDAIAGSDGKRARLRPEVMDEYARVSSQVRFVAHGVGLSIGSFDHWNENYLRLLDELFARFDLAWHGEHLAYTEVAGENVGTMLALPRTQEALDLICERVGKIQARYKVPFLLEHVIQLLPDAPAEFTPAGFLNAITSNTGCGLILDVYNLECDAHNQGLDISGFLEELDLAAVREMHLAGGVQQNGFQLDIHSRVVGDSTLKLAREVAARAPGMRAATYEFLKEAIPSLGRDTICAELARVRKAMRQ
jgi:uncharacterized protein (UPF0276 family)